MITDKFKTYSLEIIIIGIISFLAIFQFNISNKLLVAVILLIFFLIIRKILVKRQLLSINSKSVFYIMSLFGIIYLGIYYYLGIFSGFYQSTIKFSMWAIKDFIIPLALVIVLTEKIRFILVSQKAKYSSFLTLILTVLIDIVINIGVYKINDADDFLVIIGYIIFSSIASNLLYNYVSKRYGSNSIILYRLITTLYLYIIPITPDVYIFFKTLFRIIYPYIIYLTLEYSFSKEKDNAIEEESKSKKIGTTLSAIISILIVCLVSNKFRYGILVIATGSMTGTINKGDAIIFEQYDKQLLEVGTIIVFQKENIEIVHRIISIKKDSNGYIYKTKGDANQQEDDFDVYIDDIRGITKLKIKGLGYPTLMFRDLFKK